MSVDDRNNDPAKHSGERPSSPEEIKDALQSETDEPLPPELRTYAVMQEQHVGKRDASVQTGYGVDRDYGVGAQILHDLGLRRIQLLTNHPPKVAALEGFALEVVGSIPLGQPAHLKDAPSESEPTMSKKREQRT